MPTAVSRASGPPASCGASVFRLRRVRVDSAIVDFVGEPRRHRDRRESLLAQNDQTRHRSPAGLVKAPPRHRGTAPAAAVWRVESRRGYRARGIGQRVEDLGAACTAAPSAASQSARASARRCRARSDPRSAAARLCGPESGRPRRSWLSRSDPHSTGCSRRLVRAGICSSCTCSRRRSGSWRSCEA